MNVAKIVRAWGWSVLVCTVTVMLLAGLIQAGQVGGTLRGVLDMTIYFSLTFAAVALVVCVPAFLLLERSTRLLEHRAAAACAGGLIAALSSVVLVVWFFHGPGDPQTVSGWVGFWMRNAVPFSAGIAPFIVGGATFGARWTARQAEAAPSHRAHRTSRVRSSRGHHHELSERRR